MSNIPAPQDLASMAWEIQSLFDALDELMPLDSANNPPALHGLASVSYTHLTLPTSDLV